MRWEACRSSGSTDIPVSDSPWHENCSRTPLAISGDTGLISSIFLLLYWVLFRLLYSNWVMHSSRSSLQRLEIDRLELTISYFALKSLIQSFSSENIKLMSFLKLSRLRTSSISSSYGKFSKWHLVHIIFNNKLYLPFPSCYPKHNLNIFFENPLTYSQNLEPGNTKGYCHQGWKLWMNTLKKATFNNIFIHTVYNYYEQSIVTINMQNKYN